MNIDTAHIKKNQIELLLDSQKLLGKCSIAEPLEPLSFTFEEINTKNRLELQNKIKLHCTDIKENLIYTISLKNSLCVNDIQAALLKYKSRNIHALSKVNLPTEEWDEVGSILYVGSSKGSNYAARIKNHLGVGSKGVYSLHLTHWLPEISNPGIVIRTFTLEEPNHEYNNINLLEIIEQGFWDELKPMFGKRSGLL